MSFTSSLFFLFVIVMIGVYYFCVPKKYQWCVLLLGSYIFYFYAGWRMIFHLLFTTSTVYLSALWHERVKTISAKKWVVALVTLSNFSILVFYKWFFPIYGLIGKLFGSLGNIDIKIPAFSLLLPLGISFYTFQSIGYLLDVHRGRVKPERNFAKYALFVSFFPQLIQGPISRYSELADQLYEPCNIDYVQLRRGIQLILWGLFKKMVIADRLISMTTLVFSDLNAYKGLLIVFGSIASFFRLYTDFSGGVDIARGVAQMLGKNIPQNFERPLFSKSLPEFWRRWHITLNNWWRDYLFYPIVLSKPMARISRFTRKHISSSLGKVVGVYIGIFIVRIINAMWHGAEVYRVVSGFYYGLLITIGLVFTPAITRIAKFLKINRNCFSWKLFQNMRTIFLCCLAQIFINMGSVRGSLNAFVSIVRDFNPWIINLRFDFLVGLSASDVYILVISLLILFIIEAQQEKGISIRESLEKQNIAFQWLVLIGAMFIIILWGCYGLEYNATDFIYQGY